MAVKLWWQCLNCGDFFEDEKTCIAHENRCPPYEMGDRVQFLYIVGEDGRWLKGTVRSIYHGQLTMEPDVNLGYSIVVNVKNVRKLKKEMAVWPKGNN